MYSSCSFFTTHFDFVLFNTLRASKAVIKDIFICLRYSLNGQKASHLQQKKKIKIIKYLSLVRISQMHLLYSQEILLSPLSIDKATSYAPLVHLRHSLFQIIFDLWCK